MQTTWRSTIQNLSLRPIDLPLACVTSGEVVRRRDDDAECKGIATTTCRRFIVVTATHCPTTPGHAPCYIELCDEAPDLRPRERVRPDAAPGKGARPFPSRSSRGTCSRKSCRAALTPNIFLPNGARLYVDTGFHPEYATPECDAVLDLVACDRAGERIVEDLVRRAQRRLPEHGITGHVRAYKNNTDSAGNSYGCHENYLVSRDTSFGYLVETLIPFLVTRQIFTGAGRVHHGPDGYEYHLSQRALHISDEISGSTVSGRPIINTRDEPHADAGRFRRLHVIVGDSNMSEVTTLPQGRHHRPRARHDRGRASVPGSSPRVTDRRPARDLRRSSLARARAAPERALVHGARAPADLPGGERGPRPAGWAGTRAPPPCCRAGAPSSRSSPPIRWARAARSTG